MFQKSDEEILEIILAVLYCGIFLHSDTEMQDTRMEPHIDIKIDNMATVLSKIEQRGKTYLKEIFYETKTKI